MKWVGMMKLHSETNLSSAIGCFTYLDVKCWRNVGSVPLANHRINFLLVSETRHDSGGKLLNNVVERGNETRWESVFLLQQIVTSEHQHKWFEMMMITITFSDVSLKRSSSAWWKYCGEVYVTKMCFRWLLIVFSFPSPLPLTHSPSLAIRTL